MNGLRHISEVERSALRQRGCWAESWDRVLVAEDFSPEQLRNVRFEGDVTIGSNTLISYSKIRNYQIGNNCYIDSVLRLECRHESLFGGGVMVSAVKKVVK